MEIELLADKQFLNAQNAEENITAQQSSQLQIIEIIKKDQNQNSTSNYGFNQQQEGLNIIQTDLKQIFHKNKLTHNSKRESIQKKKKNKLKRAGFEDLYKNVSQEFIIRLSSGLSIDSDGVIRFSHSLGFFSFGFTSYQAQSLTYQKNSQIIDCQLFDAHFYSLTSFQTALAYIEKFNNIDYQKLTYVLKVFKDIRHLILHNLDGIKISQQMIQDHDEMYNKHIKFCEEYIKEYTEKNRFQLFQFCIGRTNIVKRDIEIIKQVFSKSYLDLLGINLENFNQILLRNQKIDLVQDRNDIINIFLNQVDKKQQFDGYVQSTCQISTFDGFKIKIYFSYKNVDINANQKKLLPVKREFVLQLAELDVDLQDLSNLISYRERIVESSQKLSFEEFMQKELSYLFENIEYSVQSQIFLEKFYQKNVKKLKKIQKLQILSFEQTDFSKCNYTFENINTIKPIQII